MEIKLHPYSGFTSVKYFAPSLSCISTDSPTPTAESQTTIFVWCTKYGTPSLVSIEDRIRTSTCVAEKH